MYEHSDHPITDADDYIMPGPDLPLLLDNERREDCFSARIIDDLVFEQDETYNLTLALDMSRPYTMRVGIADQFLSSEVTILANDGEQQPLNCDRSLNSKFYLWSDFCDSN